MHTDITLSSLLTVILNTSPGESNPSTRLIEEVVASFAHVPGLRSCRLIIVADGYKLREKASLKKGAATPAISVAYEHFLTRVDRLTQTPGSDLRGAELLVLEQRHGCAHAFRRGLSRVSTPFVMAVQHDRPFFRPVDLCPLLKVFDSPDGASVQCIALPTRLSIDHASRLVSRGIPASFFRERALTVSGVDLVPLAAFLDSTHIGRCSWFRERVFGPARRARLPRGAFLEDTMGQQQLRELRTLGPSSHEWYGTYIAQLSEPVIAHLDCHDRFSGLSTWQRWSWLEAHTPDERWAALEDGAASLRLQCERVRGFDDTEESEEDNTPSAGSMESCVDAPSL